MGTESSSRIISARDSLGGARWLPGVGLAIAGIMIALVITPRVFSFGGINAIGSSLAVVGIVALAVVVVLGVGGLDLSVAGIVEMSAAAGLVALHTFGGGTATQVLVTLSVAAAAGAVNGVLVAFLRLSSLLATLATSFVFTAIGLALTGGSPIGDVSEGVGWFRAATLGVPNALITLVVLTVIVSVVTAKTTAYRRVLLSGANRTAAVLDGARVRLAEFVVFVAGGLICGVAAIVVTGQLGAFTSGQSGDLLLLALGVSLLGGTKLFGGYVSPAGAVAGAFLLALLTVVMSLRYVEPSIQQVVQGVVLLVAVCLAAREKG